jgi:hypothetical protein
MTVDHIACPAPPEELTDRSTGRLIKDHDLDAGQHPGQLGLDGPGSPDLGGGGATGTDRYPVLLDQPQYGTDRRIGTFHGDQGPGIKNHGHRGAEL